MCLCACTSPLQPAIILYTFSILSSASMLYGTADIVQVIALIILHRRANVSGLLESVSGLIKSISCLLESLRLVLRAMYFAAIRCQHSISMSMLGLTLHVVQHCCVLSIRFSVFNRW